MRNWFSRDWLCASSPHPLRQLWQRGDQGASLELQSIAGAVRCILPSAGAALSKQWLDGITSGDGLRGRTTMFEVYMAGLFANSVPVQTVRAGQPGYDFAVQLGGSVEVRVSCKSREPSDDERRAAAFASALRARIAAQLFVGEPVELRLMSPQQPAAWLFDVERVMPQVRAAVRAARHGQPIPSCPPDRWQVSAVLLESSYPPLVFREGILSFSLLVGVTLDYDRVVQNFRSRFLDAASNVQQHSGSGPSLTNVIVYRVPEQLAMSDAEAVARDVFNTSASSHTSAVFFYRAGFYTTDTERRSYYLGHEWREVSNDRATARLASIIPGAKLSLVLFGGRAQQVEPVRMASRGNDDFALGPGFCMRLHGEHHYRMPDWSARGPSVVHSGGIALTFAYRHNIVGGLVVKQLVEEIAMEPVLL